LSLPFSTSSKQPVKASFTISGYSCTYLYSHLSNYRVFFQLFIITIYPTVIQPLFNKFTPLEDGSLKTKIDALAARIKFPLTRLYVVDGSKRSAHSNAYFYGFFKNKRIVLYDTLLKDANEEEICGVLAHELGHWNYNHVFKMLFINQIHLFLIFYSFSLVVYSKEMYQAFGFSTTPILIGFLLFQYFYVCFFVSGCLTF
jgi:STE24 endopeptidase